MDLQADQSVRGIMVANLATMMFAMLNGWSLMHLLWPFWIQSVIIGYYARKRILALQDFQTDGLKINNRPVDPTPKTQRSVAHFFALHYGFFHLFYLFFLVALGRSAGADGLVPVTNSSTGEVMMLDFGRPGVLDYAVFAALGFGFWLSHRASHREHVHADLARKPNLGSLMFLPYLRIIPMHLTIIFAAPLGGTLGVLLFSILKIVADVGMHKVEHRWLQTGQSSSSGRRSGHSASDAWDASDSSSSSSSSDASD